jgi:mycofactocin precursor
VQYPVASGVLLCSVTGEATACEPCAKEDPEVRPDELDTCASSGPVSGEREEPRIVDEIEVEDLAVDGICGVY